MARCSVGGRMSAIATATNGPSVYATTGVKPRIREIGVFNTTTTASSVGVARATTTGTRGAALTAVNESDDSHAVIATGANTHTVAPTVALSRQASIGAAIGAGVIFTFGEDGFILDNATTSGVVITCPSGTGQILDFYIVWDE
jgi:hypothetical protein